MNARIAAFKSEWKMRETLLKLEDLSAAWIERERRVMLCRYGLTEEQVDATGKAS